MIRHRIIRTLCCLPLLLPAACEHPDGNELFTEVSIRLVMPDSRPVERLEILTDISYFYNLNTYERTAFPETVERNRTTVRLRRGIYNFSSKPGRPTPTARHAGCTAPTMPTTGRKPSRG